jgi:hypothetical protein
VVQGLIGKGLNKAAGSIYRVTGTWDKPKIETVASLPLPAVIAPTPAGTALVPPDTTMPDSAGSAPSPTSPSTTASGSPSALPASPAPAASG